MSGIVFWFQNYDKDVFSGRPIDLDAWRYAMHIGGITSAKIINATEPKVDITLGGGIDFEVIGSNSQDLVDWVEKNSDKNIVVLDTPWSSQEGLMPISELNCKEVDWYVFGSADGNPKFTVPVQYVCLPQNSKVTIHSLHIASAVLFRHWEKVNGG